MTEPHDAMCLCGMEGHPHDCDCEGCRQLPRHWSKECRCSEGALVVCPVHGEADPG